MEEDTYTNFVVNSYMRIPNDNNHHSSFAIEIILLVIKYIEDHFAINKFSFQWIIDIELSKQMHNSFGAKILSNAFNKSGIEFALGAYEPGGVRDISHLIVYLTIKKIPKTWKRIYGFMELKCIETNTNYVEFVCMTTDSEYGWSEYDLWTECIETDNLTIICDFIITRITYINNNNFEWRIDGELMDGIKNPTKRYHSKKLFTSPCFNDMWYFVIYPKGWKGVLDPTGHLQIELWLVSLPTNADSVWLTCQLVIKDMDDGVVYSDKIDKEWDMINTDMCWKVKDAFLFDKLRDYGTLIFVMNIWEISQIESNDVDGMNNELQLYQQQMDKIEQI